MPFRPSNSNVVPLFGAFGDAAPAGGAVDPNDPITVAQGGENIMAGSAPALVQKLQLLLASWGLSPGSADGIYGGNTATAVRGLQAKLGLPQDGIFGPGTAGAVAADLARGSGSILRGNAAMFRQPALPPAGGAAPPVSATFPTAAKAPLPATMPAQAQVPWLWVFGGAAALLFLLSRFRDGSEGTVLAPPGSVVADVDDEEGDEDLLPDVEVTEEPPAPEPVAEVKEKPKRKRKPRKPRQKKLAAVEVTEPEVVTPDEVLPPPTEPAIDVEYEEV